MHTNNMGKTKYTQDAKNCTICVSAASCSGTTSAMIAVMSIHRACWVVKHYTTTQKKNAPSQSAPRLRLRTQMQWTATCTPLRLASGTAWVGKGKTRFTNDSERSAEMLRTCISPYCAHLQKYSPCSLQDRTPSAARGSASCRTRSA